VTTEAVSVTSATEAASVTLPQNAAPTCHVTRISLREAVRTSHKSVASFKQLTHILVCVTPVC
jgi:hypothetical protein